MTSVFADTFFWVALANPNDTAHRQALLLHKQLYDRPIVTTDEVLIEFLNFFSEHGPHFRRAVARSATGLLESGAIRVIEQSRASLREGLALYESRLDKGYSLTDCISMTVMRREGIFDVLTNDAHFTREGFQALFR